MSKASHTFTVRHVGAGIQPTSTFGRQITSLQKKADVLQRHLVHSCVVQGKETGPDRAVYRLLLNGEPPVLSWLPETAMGTHLQYMVTVLNHAYGEPLVDNVRPLRPRCPKGKKC